MDLPNYFKKNLRASKPRKNGPVAFLHWDSQSIHYLIAAPNSVTLRPRDFGVLPRIQDESPFQSLKSQLQADGVRVSRVVVLLSRAEVEMQTLSLPPASKAELPDLIRSSVEEQIGESEDEGVIDFLLHDSAAATDSSVVAKYAFSIGKQRLEELSGMAEESGFSLVALGVRHLAPIGVLKHGQLAENALSIAVHMYESEVELSICAGTKPVFLRSLRIANEDAKYISTKLVDEANRCLATSSELERTPKATWRVFSSDELAWKVAGALEEQGEDVQTIDPLVGWNCIDSQAEESNKKFRSAANSGAAWDFLQGKLPVDMLAPKEAPKVANPYVRWGAMASAAVLTLALGVYFMLSDIGELRTQVADLEGQLATEKKLAAKFAEKQDEVMVIDQWLSNRVDWLEELNTLSERLPVGPDATVTRLNANSSGGAASFDLSLRVAEQEVVAEFEQSVRGAKFSANSKRISRSPDATEFPWQFETKIGFAITPEAWHYAEPADPLAAELKADGKVAAELDSPIDSPKESPAIPVLVGASESKGGAK